MWQQAAAVEKRVKCVESEGKGLGGDKLCSISPEDG